MCQVLVNCLSQAYPGKSVVSRRVSAGLKFTSDILSKQPQYCLDVWKFFRTFRNTHFYHYKRKLPSALLKLKPVVVLLPFRMISAT